MIADWRRRGRTASISGCAVAPEPKILNDEGGFLTRKNSTPRMTIGTFWRWHQPSGNQCVHQNKNRSKALLTRAHLA
jgi:hypothetical protein